VVCGLLFARVAGKNKRRGFLDAVEISATIVLIIFGIYYANRFLGGYLNAFGIWPRHSRGLPGILFSPLLHYSDAHLMANAVSLFLLLVILFLNREYRPDLAFLSIWILSGLGTWLIGRAGSGGQPVIHIGASGVIYGLVTYLIASAWWLRSWTSFFWAVAILFLYGGIFHGVLPQRGIVSWEGHLSGAVAGVFVAWRQHR
jgi:membrane associated rhomboid family serine protease